MRRTLDGTVHVRRELQQYESATQQWLPLARFAAILNRVFLASVSLKRLFPNSTRRSASSSVPVRRGSQVGVEVHWGARRAHQALRGIDALIRQKYNTRRLQPQYTFRPVTVPVEPRAMPTDVGDRFDEFERGRWYSGWSKSILPVASFDAETTE